MTKKIEADEFGYPIERGSNEASPQAEAEAMRIARAEERTKWAGILRAWSNRCEKWADEAEARLGKCRGGTSAATQAEHERRLHSLRAEAFDDAADVIEASNERPFGVEELRSPAKTCPFGTPGCTATDHCDENDGVWRCSKATPDKSTEASSPLGDLVAAARAVLAQLVAKGSGYVVNGTLSPVLYHGLNGACLRAEDAALGSKAAPGASDAYGLPNDLQAAKAEIHEWRQAVEALGVMGGPDALRNVAVALHKHHDEHHAREDALQSQVSNAIRERDEAKALVETWQANDAEYERLYRETKAKLDERGRPEATPDVHNAVCDVALAAIVWLESRGAGKDPDAKTAAWQRHRDDEADLIRAIRAIPTGWSRESPSPKGGAK